MAKASRSLQRKAAGSEPTVDAPAETERRIRAAMDRLLDGEPERTDGELTLVNVAAEARVGRATVYRADPLLAEWRERVAALAAAQDARHPVARLGKLKAEMARTAREHAERLRDLETRNVQLAQQVQALTLLLERERRQRAGSGGVSGDGLSPPGGEVTPIVAARLRSPSGPSGQGI